MNDEGPLYPNPGDRIRCIYHSWWDEYDQRVPQGTEGTVVKVRSNGSGGYNIDWRTDAGVLVPDCPCYRNTIEILGPSSGDHVNALLRTFG